MTDNRTTELLDGLRNVGNLHEFAELFGFDWNDESDWTWHDVAVKMADGLEQAIAATLGDTTCEFVIEDNMNESEGMGDVWFRCTNCGTCYDYCADDWLLKASYCPRCGATVKGVR